MVHFTVQELIKNLKAGEIKPVELLSAYMDRIQALDPKVKAFVTITGEQALKKAESLGTKPPENRPLWGVPVAIKDNMCTEGVNTTCSSKILHNFKPPYDAAVVERLDAAGAVMVGKTNLDEFAMGSSTENSGFFVTRNPWNLDCVPGGSSGGSAAAVSASMAPWALGSDTGGSIRQPASFCGVVGLKPTYGRVSRYGLVAYASSLDQIGPITKNVYDCALMMNIISGHDPRDTTCAELPAPDFTARLNGEIKGLKLGIPKEFMGQGIAAPVKESILNAAKTLEGLGADIQETSLPYIDYALPCYYIVAPAEASSNLARYDGVQYGHRCRKPVDVIDLYMRTRAEGFGAEVKRRIMLGTYVLSSGYYDAYYLKALKVRTLVKRDFDLAFEKFDALLSPTSPTVAFKVGDKVSDPLSMYLSDICTIPINLAGIPAVSLPCGFQDGLPIGLQIMGKIFSEETILRLAYAFEQATEFHKKQLAI